MNENEKVYWRETYHHLANLAEECKTISDLLDRGFGDLDLFWGDNLDIVGHEYGITYNDGEFTVTQQDGSLSLSPSITIQTGDYDRRPDQVTIHDL